MAEKLTEERESSNLADRPGIIEGRRHVDDRGSLTFFNEFAFSGVRRFYLIRPNRPNAIRGWVGHRSEQKWFSAVEGTVLVAVVRPDDWQSPNARVPVSKFVLSASNPRILALPPGHATAIMGLSAQSALLVFSNFGIAEAASDDYRFPADCWAIPGQGSEA
jgi:dTDP-4-dehydrorhamnose 3,5-epimerase